MAALADAFVALPGGFGTFDELCEMATWDQLGIHAKPLVLVNVDGYFDGFLRADRPRRGRRLPQARAPRRCSRWSTRVDDVFDAIARWQAPPVVEVAASPPPSREAARDACRTTCGAAIRGVLADIDDTITTHGRLDAGGVRGARAVARRGQARDADHRPARGLVRSHRAHVAGRRGRRRERRVLHALRRDARASS